MMFIVADIDSHTRASGPMVSVQISSTPEVIVCVMGGELQRNVRDS